MQTSLPGFACRLVFCLAAATIVVSTRIGTAAQPDVVTLFDGESLTGWLLDSDHREQVVAADGELRLSSPTGWVLAEKPYFDFILTFEARAAADTVGGVLVRTLHAKETHRVAYEVRLTSTGDGVGDLWRLHGNQAEPVLQGKPDITLDRTWQEIRIECRRDILVVQAGSARVLGIQGLPHNWGQVGFAVQRGQLGVRKMQLTVIEPERRPSPPGALSVDTIGLEKPRVRREVRPQYTQRAMGRRIQGNVLMEVVIRPDGSVSDVQVLQSLDADLDRSAVDTVKRWRFHPGKIDGVGVPVVATVEMTFTLK